MGIYIPNMSKPKFCKDGENICFAWDDKKYKCRVTEWKKPCPLIEIDLVRCGECKHLEVINKAPIYAHCHKWGYDFELWQEDTRKSFCSYGERRKEKR